MLALLFLHRNTKTHHRLSIQLFLFCLACIHLNPKAFILFLLLLLLHLITSHTHKLLRDTLKSLTEKWRTKGKQERDASQLKQIVWGEDEAIVKVCTVTAWGLDANEDTCMRKPVVVPVCRPRPRWCVHSRFSVKRRAAVRCASSLSLSCVFNQWRQEELCSSQSEHRGLKIVFCWLDFFFFFFSSSVSNHLCKFTP